MKRYMICAVTAMLTAFGGAQAAVISGLVNTGISASGTEDDNYSLTVEQGETRLDNAYGYVSRQTIWPSSPWLANSTVSKWITPEVDTWQSFDANRIGVYKYQLQFDLSRYDASSAIFTGRYAADNDATVYLNGQQIAGGSNFSRWTGFSADDGFLDGLNTLEFVVTNFQQRDGNPTGLRVEFVSSDATLRPQTLGRFSRAALVQELPEPGTYSVFIAGLMMMGWMRRRKSGRAI
ncbi:MAG: PEP-CTERM sorting domain-containing protein [Pseudomonadota bacterium]